MTHRPALYYLARSEQERIARAMVRDQFMPKDPAVPLALTLAAFTSIPAIRGRLMAKPYEAAAAGPANG